MTPSVSFGSFWQRKSKHSPCVPQEAVALVTVQTCRTAPQALRALVFGLLSPDTQAAPSSLGYPFARSTSRGSPSSMTRYML